MSDKIAIIKNVLGSGYHSGGETLFFGVMLNSASSIYPDACLSNAESLRFSIEVRVL